MILRDNFLLFFENFKKLKLIILFSLGIHFFLYEININTYWNSGLLVLHTGIARNVAEKGLIHQSPKWITLISDRQNAEYKLVEPFIFAHVPNDEFSYPAFERNPGYGILLGYIWRLTGKYSYNAIRLIQIFINSFFVIIIYLLF